MRLGGVFRFVILASFLSASLASGLARAGEVRAVRAYSKNDVALIMAMRDDGKSLAAVAKVVGGTRDDVRSAEKAEIARRRALRAAPSPTTVPDSRISIRD